MPKIETPFHAADGVERGLEDDLHDSTYTVVGILEPSATPYDHAVYVTGARTFI